MVYRREYYADVLARIQEPRHFMQVIVGPRQVGKSTLVSQVLEEVNIPFRLENADNVNPKDTDWIRRIWEAARSQQDLGRHEDFLLVVDEVQKIDNWSEAVKREWDADTFNRRSMKVILLGSSRLLIRKGLTESLAGRFEMIRMGHWRFREMQDAFGWNLDQYIYFGGYPGTAAFVENEARWRRYIKDSLVAPAIEKDVIQTSNIYKPALMKQVFELGCSYSGELLSLTKISGQLQEKGNVTTLASYLNILRECALLTGLQKFSADEARKYNSIPKFQVFNNALLTAYRAKNYEQIRTSPMLWGRWVESAVGAHLLSQAEELDYRLYYWRERDEEVDFIVQSNERILAIEVKSGRRGMNSGLPAFEKLFHPDARLVVGTQGIPIEDFLRASIAPLL